MARFIELETDTGQLVPVNPEHVEAIVLTSDETSACVQFHSGSELVVKGKPRSVAKILAGGDEPWRCPRCGGRLPHPGGGCSNPETPTEFRRLEDGELLSHAVLRVSHEGSQFQAMLADAGADDTVGFGSTTEEAVESWRRENGWTGYTSVAGEASS